MSVSNSEKLSLILVLTNIFVNSSLFTYLILHMMPSLPSLPSPYSLLMSLLLSLFIWFSSFPRSFFLSHFMYKLNSLFNAYFMTKFIYFLSSVAFPSLFSLLIFFFLYIPHSTLSSSSRFHLCLLCFFSELFCKFSLFCMV